MSSEKQKKIFNFFPCEVSGIIALQVFTFLNKNFPVRNSKRRFASGEKYFTFKFFFFLFSSSFDLFPSDFGSFCSAGEKQRKPEIEKKIKLNGKNEIFGISFFFRGPPPLPLLYSFTPFFTLSFFFYQILPFAL